jgi:hypothetical protein
MKWTTDTPKESGFYWHRSLIANTKCHFEPSVVEVKVDHSDPEWPVESYSSCNYEMDWYLSRSVGDLWAGPIPLPDNRDLPSCPVCGADCTECSVKA